MTPRAILLFVTDLEIGGTPTVVRELAIRLRAGAPGVRVEVACLGVAGPVAGEIEAAGIRVTAQGARAASDLRVLPRFVRLVRDGRFDTVLSFLVHANAVAAAASLWVRDVRWIQSIQTTQPWPRWHWMVQRLAHRAAERVVVPSSSAADVAAHWANVPREKIVVIPNAVDVGEFDAIRSSTLLLKTPPYPIIFLGRLDPVKDVPTLVHAVALLQGLVHLHIWGEGSDRPRIQAAIQEHRASLWITMHGAAANPQTALAGAGLLVLPSLAEGFGLVLIEAMAAGIPVVATDVPGIRDVVRSGQTGILTPPGDARALAKAIDQVVKDQSLREHLAAEGRRQVKTRFSWQAVMMQYRELLRL